MFKICYWRNAPHFLASRARLHGNLLIKFKGDSEVLILETSLCHGCWWFQGLVAVLLVSKMLQCEASKFSAF